VQRFKTTGSQSTKKKLVSTSLFWFNKWEKGNILGMMQFGLGHKSDEIGEILIINLLFCFAMNVRMASCLTVFGPSLGGDYQRNSWNRSVSTMFFLTKSSSTAPTSFMADWSGRPVHPAGRPGVGVLEK
jgi:hypothetical protein